MSIKLMALAWDLQIPATEKMVLLCLCDYANGEGTCWPGAETMGERCSLTERTIRKALKWLEDECWIASDPRPGKTAIYRIDPGNKFTPEVNSPRNMTTKPRKHIPDTPEAASDEPSKNHQEPSIDIEVARARDQFPKPDWADAQVWADFMFNRKKAKNTATAFKGFLTDIAKLANDEWPPGRLLEYAVAKGWMGIYQPKEGYPSNAQRNGEQNIRSGRSDGPDKRTGLERAIDREIGI